MAIREERRISFDRETVQQAFATTSYTRARLNLPPGTPYEVDILPDDRLVRATYRSDPQIGSSTVVELAGPELAVLLMQLCRNRRIPLPRDAAKRLVFAPEAVTLVAEQSLI